MTNALSILEPSMRSLGQEDVWFGAHHLGPNALEVDVGSLLRLLGGLIDGDAYVSKMDDQAFVEARRGRWLCWL